MLFEPPKIEGSNPIQRKNYSGLNIKSDFRGLPDKNFSTLEIRVFSMPFTPFHFGPAILIGLLFLKKIDFPTFIAANVMIDWRAFLVFFGLWDGPLHGWVHTYLGATLMAILLGTVMIYVRPLIDKELKEMNIVQKISKKKIFLASFLGAFIHVTLDAIHHPLMQPFAPFNWRPLYGIFSTAELRAFTFFCLLAGTGIYILYVMDWIDLPSDA